MSHVVGLHCLTCGARVSAQPFRYYCPSCRGLLEVDYDYEAMRASLSRAQLDARRGSILEQWLELLPIEQPERIRQVSLGERPTPQIRASRLFPRSDADIWVKNESVNPTCSLKDRSIPITVVKALEFGYSSVGIVSSGNASSSLAAYAARAGLRAVVFVRRNSSPSKMFKTMTYRPVALQIQGTQEEVDEQFVRARDEFGFMDCNGLVNPYRLEGKKTFAYEVARDLGWRAPDVVIMPTGYGNGITAAWKGFKELKRLGLIDSLPRMVAVQPAVCAPIVRAFQFGATTVAPVPPRVSLAEAVSTHNPEAGGVRVLQTVRESDGAAIGVEEDEIVEAVRLLAEQEGVSAEPTGAIAVAATLKLAREGSPLAQGVVVVSVTGHGLNNVEVGARFIPSPVQVGPDYKAVRSALRQALSGG